MKISPARTAAFDVLARIQRERAFSSILLPEYESSLSSADRALCHNLTLGVLRRQIFLDRVIDNFAGGKKLDPAVRTALQLGLFQLHFLDRIPDHSAVNESVNLVQRGGKTSAKGMVNAVLRRSLRENFRPVGVDELDQLVLDTSHPRWLLEKWIARWGVEETRRLAAANNETPDLAFRFTRAKAGNKSLPYTRPSKLVSGCYVAGQMTPELAAAAANGEIYFQDEGSQLVGATVRVRPGQKFLDVCAAPGSKLTQIASRAADDAVLFVGGDLHAHRARFLLENCRRQSLGAVSVVQYDAEEPLPFAEQSFDVVLVDAPCSGTGTIRHNPELRYFLERADFDELSSKQRRILKNASNLVKPGGELIYSTCSLEIEENEMVADGFLAANEMFSAQRPDVQPELMTSGDRVQTLPQRDAMDGFFIAAFLRSGS